MCRLHVFEGVASSNLPPATLVGESKDSASAIKATAPALVVISLFDARTRARAAHLLPTVQTTRLCPLGRGRGQQRFVVITVVGGNRSDSG